MKKIIIIAIILILLINCPRNNLIIPDQAIRFRIIANSNSEEDQELKKEIIKNISKDIINISSSSTTIEEVRKNINNKLPNINNKINKLLENQNIKADYEINYGVNYFPEKEYKGITYEEGNYESIVIKLGEGKGENFWCVLFPPLCLLEVEEKNNADIEYTSFIKEIIDKYF